MKLNKKKEEKKTTINGTLKEILGTNANKIAPFVRWYCDNDTDYKTEKNYDNDIKNITQVSFDAASDWLLLENVQNAVKYYFKSKELKENLEMYYCMKQKARNGDVRAAEFVMKFFDSDMFKKVAETDMEKEAEDYLSKVDIPLFEK